MEEEGAEGGGGGGGGGGAGVSRPLSGEERSWRERAAVWLEAVASMPSWMICALKKAFSFSSTVIWLCMRESALADFSASLAVVASCSFWAKRSFRYSTVLSNTVPLLYTYCAREGENEQTTVQGMELGLGKVLTYPDNIACCSVFLLTAWNNLGQCLDHIIDPVPSATLH